MTEIGGLCSWEQRLLHEAAALYKQKPTAESEYLVFSKAHVCRALRTTFVKNCDGSLNDLPDGA